MKILNTIAKITLVSTSISFFSSVISLEIHPTFREGNYKNIIFSVSQGGSSHHNWVLSIVDLLNQRGHNATYLTTTEETHFSKPYKNVRTVDIGKSVEYDKAALLKELSSGESMSKIMFKVFTAWAGNHERDYFTLLKYFKENKVDLALCDFFMNACVDAATTFGIPYIVTCALDPTKESDASYINSYWYNMNDFSTEFQSFSKRFKNKFILFWLDIYNNYPYVKSMNEKRKSILMKTKFESHTKTWKDSLRLVNNVFGFIPARPIGPLAEYIGPIVPKVYKPLPDDLELYLNAHKRVAYIAFGQLAIPNEQSIRMILTGLLESIESGSLDGFIWATVHAAGNFPNIITTSLGITYDIQDMFNNANPHGYFIKWAPQMAVLLHPSTCLFVSHGGLGSWHESMYAGIPMVMFPFFADQPGNALLIEREGLGGIINHEASIEDTVRLFKNITENVEIKANVKRMQALTQIHSEHGTIKGADLVEEVAYTHKNGKLPHRQSPANRMSFIKSHNIDLYVALGFIIVLGITPFFTFSL